MAKPRKAAPKSAAAKKAMAERGTFKVGSNSSYDKPYSHLVASAVAPYVAASKASVSVWGDTLVGCVPPAFAVRYQQLKNEQDGQAQKKSAVVQAHRQQARIDPAKAGEQAQDSPYRQNRE